MARDTPAIPDHVRAALERLWGAGHAAYVVGGSLRDTLLGREAADWDVATSARPEEILGLFPGGHYENRFGTVDADGLEITTFRRDHRYADHRRPDTVTFTDSIDEDLARRDFTINAIAWGRDGDEAGLASEPRFVDPTGGRADVDARVLRAVGDPDTRFDEDALRLLRAARLAAQLGFTIEPATLDAMRRQADLVTHLSAERVGQELQKMLGADPPSRAFRILADAALLEPLFPELAAQRGIPQNKVAGEDLFDHTLRSLDAAAEIAPGDERLMLAALLHDVGKPETYQDGHFPAHDEMGARIAERLLTRLAVARRDADEVVELIRAHMFGYERGWSDAAVRRFIRRVGVDRVERLLFLRAADNVGSGKARDAGDLEELRDRVRGELARRVPLSLRELAVDGHDIVRELGLPPGPAIGAILDRLLESVISDPARNRRDVLLTDARRWAVQMGALEPATAS